MDGRAAEDALAEGLDDFVLVLDGRGDETAERTAILLCDDDIMLYVHETSGEVTCISGLEGGISQTLTGTVGGDEVLEHGHALLKVGHDRILDDFSS